MRAFLFLNDGTRFQLDPSEFESTSSEVVSKGTADMLSVKKALFAKIDTGGWISVPHSSINHFEFCDDRTV
jgi:hypothetical protein